MDKQPTQHDNSDNPWLDLRRLTPARIALGRTGTSLPTRAQLDFQCAHAQARDAVHLAFDHAGLREQLSERGRDSILLHSAASDRHSYLQRPDLGGACMRNRPGNCASMPRPTRAGSTWRSSWPTASRPWRCTGTRCRFSTVCRSTSMPRDGPPPRWCWWSRAGWRWPMKSANCWARK